MIMGTLCRVPLKNIAFRKSLWTKNAAWLLDPQEIHSVPVGLNTEKQNYIGNGNKNCMAISNQGLVNIMGQLSGSKAGNVHWLFGSRDLTVSIDGNI